MVFGFQEGGGLGKGLGRLRSPNGGQEKTLEEASWGPSLHFSIVNKILILVRATAHFDQKCAVADARMHVFDIVGNVQKGDLGGDKGVIKGRLERQCNSIIITKSQMDARTLFSLILKALKKHGFYRHLLAPLLASRPLLGGRGAGTRNSRAHKEGPWRH